MNFRCFVIPPIKYCSMPGTRDESGGTAFAQIVDQRVTLLPVGSTEPDFDQLMVSYRRLEFRQQRVGDAAAADHNGRLELVAEAAQEPFLRFSQMHAIEF